MYVVQKKKGADLEGRLPSGTGLGGGGVWRNASDERERGTEGTCGKISISNNRAKSFPQVRRQKQKTKDLALRARKRSETQQSQNKKKKQRKETLRNQPKAVSLRHRISAKAHKSQIRPPPRGHSKPL